MSGWRIRVVGSFGRRFSAFRQKSVGSSREKEIPDRNALFDALRQPMFKSIVPPTEKIDIRDALSFWRFVSPPKPISLEKSHQTAVLLAVECEDVQLARIVADRGYELSFNFYDNVVQAYCNQQGNVEDALSLVALMEHRNLTPAPESWHAVALAQIRQGQGNNALDTCERMRRLGIKPSRLVYNSLLTLAFCLDPSDRSPQLTPHSLIQRLLSDWLKPDLDCFDVLLAHATSREEVRHILADVKSADLVPTSKTWDILIEACLRCGSVVNNRWGRPVPSRETIDWILAILSGGKVNAKRLDSTACDRLLKACLHGRNLGAAMRVFNLMRHSHSIVPTPKGYGTLLRLVAEKGRDVALAHYLWQDILDVYDGSPPSWAYASMLEPMAKFRGVEGIYYMRSLMLECGVDLDASSSSKHWAYSSSIYHALIRSSCTAKDAALAWSYYDEMKSPLFEKFHLPDEETFAALLLTIKTRSDFERYASRILEEMARNGVSKSGLMRRPFMLMCSRVRLGSGGAMNHSNGFDKLTCSSVLETVEEVEPRAHLKRRSGLICSAVVNVILRTVQNPVMTESAEPAPRLEFDNTLFIT
ncbi:uncharacterized protein [Oscarella lobularis]|uniref:uncharacterized protein isoform X2 n=1 Tax=Oscarella lobularis TaxID=121494 RepID=UPI0033136C76